ncbi:hypothetical protein [Pontibacter sp. G13]|uniref:hypothetical protein n=1 Tax=Pontibacter sp. G13 TaxID=3074898 RepID=UPI00288BC52F|nr:hypothetical protein [Pontibacter sp. G13]WNJ20441.1 hypothetical protein RJD25_08165 [Pontibacter sp. G13]
MKRFIRSGLICMGLISMVHLAFAQHTERWGVQIQAGHQDILYSEDVGQLGVAHNVVIRPAYTVALQRFWGKNPRSRGFVALQYEYANNLYLHDWHALETGIGFQGNFSQKFWAGLQLDGGLCFFRESDPQYIYEDEVWVKAPNQYQTRTFLKAALNANIGYHLLNIQGHPIDLFTQFAFDMVGHWDYGLLPYGKMGFGVGYGF